MNKEVIILIIIVIIIFIFFVYKYINGSEKLKNTKKDDNLKVENIDNNKKIIQYFGGDYCPFSNSDSNAYKIIKDFEETYGDKIICKYYWVGNDDDYMKKLNVMYVPTILNGNNEQVELKLPALKKIELPTLKKV